MRTRRFVLFIRSVPFVPLLLGRSHFFLSFLFPLDQVVHLHRSPFSSLALSRGEMSPVWPPVDQIERSGGFGTSEPLGFT